MNAMLWVLQGLLAAVFAFSGVAKSMLSKERLIAGGQTGVTPFPLPLIRFTAVCELLGALGMILPGLLRVAVVLTPLAAAGFAVIMVAAIASHAWLREPVNVAGTSALLLVAVAVSAGRFAG
ncbi:MAG: DoxX family protein [Actinoallomurus sp.]